ncbi:MAG: four helix bundle protein [Kofleriaceae bacterium]|jgi:four helix bundle protein|nr:four helix bundle protein [Kofleriaceae bacterium]MBP9171659.1 four helix bundle protein [Kofleriaceae bacterium]MBP9860135.1 four helix bundle protein [Kofleriaceae bacterium]
MPSFSSSISSARWSRCACTCKRGPPALADQLRRAATSIGLNLSEGVRRTGRDKKHSYRIAAAEAQETKFALEVALAWRWLDEPAVATVRVLADRVGAVTYALAR